MTGRLHIVVGGQFGSEAKGHVAAQLGDRLAPGSLVVRTGGPNAGHTVIDELGVEWKLRHVPTPAARRDDLVYALAARSVVNADVLGSEMNDLYAAGREFTMWVDPAATMLTQDHIDEEEETGQMHAIGSTRKGIGAARKARISRVGPIAADTLDPSVLADVAGLMRETLLQGRDVLIEAAQGYGLGLHTPYYPYCTSADCTAIDALADCRFSPWQFGVRPEVWMVLRPYPIRVAGTSGPLAGETTWDDLGLPEEHTTVTKKVRRVGQWDPELAYEAAVANGGDPNIALTMIDQVIPELAGQDSATEMETILRSDLEIARDLNALLAIVRNDTGGCSIQALGTGPATMVFAKDVPGRMSW
jgi:adenylosuccinate synthase